MARLPADGCLVPSEPFCEIVQEFVRSWNRDRPQPGGQFGIEADDAAPIRAIAWLASAAGLSESAIENLYSYTRRGPNGEKLLGRFPMVELRVADAVACALERTDVFYDPRLLDENGRQKVIPNPRATQQAQIECCGGSTRAASAAA